MINVEATIEKFGYNPNDLKTHSKKIVVAICEDCGKNREIRKTDYRKLCLSCGHSGEKNSFFGKEHSEESKEKNRQKHLGNKHSLETRKKMSMRKLGENHPLYGKHLSIETRKKMSEIRKGKYVGENSHRWKGGRKVAVRKSCARRKEILDPNPIELNKDFKGSEGHHIDKKFIINIPEEMHHSTFHRQTDGLGMKEINKEAFKYIYNHREDLMISEQETFNINLQIYETR